VPIIRCVRISARTYLLYRPRVVPGPCGSLFPALRVLVLTPRVRKSKIPQAQAPNLHRNRKRNQAQRHLSQSGNPSFTTILQESLRCSCNWMCAVPYGVPFTDGGADWELSRVWLLGSWSCYAELSRNRYMRLHLGAE
jgi:hypothetical protein